MSTILRRPLASTLFIYSPCTAISRMFYCVAEGVSTKQAETSSTKELTDQEMREAMKVARENYSKATQRTNQLKKEVQQSKKLMSRYKKQIDVLRKNLRTKKNPVAAKIKSPRLCTSASLIYASMKTKESGTEGRSNGKTVFEEISKHRAHFKSLSDAERAPFEAQASANRQARVLLRRELKGLRMTPYALFVQDQYRIISSTLPGPDGPTKMSSVGKALSERWCSLNNEEREVYQARARTIRSAAASHLSERRE